MIDPRIRSPWPEEVLSAVRTFRQGHLVDRPPFMYVGSPAHQLWRSEVPDAGDHDVPGEFWFDLDARDRPPFGLITTQTCDIFEDRPVQRQPWIGIAPVYDATPVLDRGQRGHLDRARIGHLVRLTSPRLPNGLWVGDLRIDVPVEKGWLVGREPIEAFATEDEYRVLAERLAHRKNRPAVATIVMETVVKPLKTWLEGPGTRWHEELKTFRLEVSGTPFDPTGARLVVLGDSVEDLSEAREALDAWWAEAASNASARGIGLLPNLYTTLDELTARQYSESMRLDFDYLSPEG